MQGRAGLKAMLAAVVVSQAVGFSATAARGQPPEPPRQTPQAQAEQLAAQAYELHAAGKYVEAIAAYLQAYEVSKAGGALLNVATIYDWKLHERERAAEYYRLYLGSADVEADLVERATARLAALGKEEATEEAARRSTELAAAPPPAPAAQPATVVAHSVSLSAMKAAPRETEARRGASWRTAGFVVGGAGVAGLGTGLILGALAMATNRDANALCDGAACRTEEGVRLAQNAGRLATASTVSFFAGLALAGGGLTMVLTAPKASSGATLAISPHVGATILALSVHGGF